MKKILLVISLISVLLLTGCGKNEKVDNVDILEDTNNQQQEEVTNDQENENNDIKQESKELNLMYTSLESLKEDGLIPSEVEVDKYYDIGKVKINTKVYDLKYKKIEYEKEYVDEKIIKEHYLALFENDFEKKSFMIGSSYWMEEYDKEISILKINI